MMLPGGTKFETIRSYDDSLGGFSLASKGPPKGFTELKLDWNPDNHKKSIIHLMEGFAPGLGKDDKGKEVQEIIFNRVRQTADDMELPMGLASPNEYCRVERIS